MVKYTWHNGDVPDNLKVTQVYGALFTKNGQILLMARERDNQLIFSLSGGTTELYDKDMEATLRRELYEEINTTIEKPILLGYQEVDEGNGKPVYAQVRMAAMIEEIGESRPDLDGGETYKRLLTNPKRAIELLNWGESGRLMIEEAVRIVKEKLKVKFTFKKDKWV